MEYNKQSTIIWLIDSVVVSSLELLSEFYNQPVL
jgi:hypothetical protein